MMVGTFVIFMGATVADKYGGISFMIIAGGYTVLALYILNCMFRLIE
jgi:hypothetical protein